MVRVWSLELFGREPWRSASRTRPPQRIPGTVPRSRPERIEGVFLAMGAARESASRRRGRTVPTVGSRAIVPGRADRPGERPRGMWERRIGDGHDASWKAAWRPCVESDRTNPGGAIHRRNKKESASLDKIIYSFAVSGRHRSPGISIPRIAKIQDSGYEHFLLRRCLPLAWESYI